MAEPLPDTIFQPPGMVGATAGQEAAAGALDIGVGAAQNVSEIINNHLADRAQITGKLAGAAAGSRIDPNTGELLPIESLPPLNDTSIYSQAYRDAALQTYANTAIAQGQAQAEVAAQQNPADPAGFGTQWNAYIQKTIGKAQPMAVGLIQPALAAIGARYTGDLTRQAVEIQQQDHAAAFKTANQVVQNNTQATLRQITDQPGVKLDPDQLKRNQQQAADTINADMTWWQHGADAAAAAFPQIFTPTAVENLRRDRLKTLWTGFFNNQAAAFANREVPVGGKYQPDSDNAATYLQNPDIAGLVEKGLFSDAEIQKIKSDGSATFDAQVRTNTQKYTNDTSAAEAGFQDTMSSMQTQAGKLFAEAKASGDPTAYNAYLNSIQEQKPQLSLDQGESQKRLDEIVQGGQQKMNEFLGSLREMNITGIMATANAPGVDHAHPNIIPDTASGFKQSMLMQTYALDKKSGNPDGQAHAYDDPAQFNRLMLDDKAGFVWHTGHLPPRFTDEVANFVPAAGNAQQTANILENYHTLMKDPFAARLVTPEMSDNVKRIEASLASPDPAEAYKLLKASSSNKAAEYESGKENAAQAVVNGYAQHPETATQDIEKAGNHAISSSATFPTLFRDFYGSPDPSSAEAVPGAFRPGIVGETLTFLGAPQDWQQYLGIAPGGNKINILTDEKTDKAFAANVGVAVRNGSSADNGDAQNAALGQMADSDYSLSRLLFSQRLLQSDVKNSEAGMGASYVYGYGAPEHEYGLPAKTVAAKISMDYADAVGKMFKDTPVAQLASEGLIVSRLEPPGSPNYLALQAKAGNLRVEPHLINNRMEYDVSLRAQTPMGDQWIPINPPGQYWHYDMVSTGDTAQQIKDAQVGGAVGGRVRTFFGNNVIGRLAGEATGGVAAWVAEEQAVNAQLEKASSDYRLRTPQSWFDRFNTALPQK